MKKTYILVLILLITHLEIFSGHSAFADYKKLSIEKIFDSPDLNGPSPRGLKFSPDGKRITYLKAKLNNKDILDLWEYDFNLKKHQLLVDSQKISNEKKELSEEEKARKERKRISASGITEYFWDHKGHFLIFPQNGDIYLYDLTSKKSVRLTDTVDAEIDVRFSPNDNFISFIRNQNLFILRLKDKNEKQITFGKQDFIKYGMAEFIAQEEMDRDSGYWWSKDENHIALTYVDESPIEIVDRYEINAKNINIVKQRYPYAGANNAIVKLLLAEIPNDFSQSVNLTEIPISNKNNYYLTRVNWLPNSQDISFQIQSRNQKRLDLFFYNLKSKKSRLVLTEKNKHWTTITNDLTFLKDSQHFIWSSEKSGFLHLYLYDISGKLIRSITQGPWEVEKLIKVNEEKGTLFFTSGYKTPTERNLFEVSFKEKNSIKKITQEEGWHNITIDETNSYYIDYYSNIQNPPQVSLHTLNGDKIIYIEENKIQESHPLFPYMNGFQKYQFNQFTTKNRTELYYNYLIPKTPAPKNGYPVVLWIYGGPGVQTVKNSWSWSMGLWHQYLAQNGFLVLQIDNRGSSGRGRKFSDWIYHRLGFYESNDYAEVINELVHKKLIDKNNILIGGWSYGGFMSLMSAALHSNLFKAAISVAPVTDWSLYDTHYTERFLGTPEENPKGYKNSNVLNFASHIKSSLLLIHGMADDNVLFSNSTMLIKELQNQGLIFQTMFYPGAKHGIYGKQNKIHVFSTMTKFIKDNLKDE